MGKLSSEGMGATFLLNHLSTLLVHKLCERPRGKSHWTNTRRQGYAMCSGM